jgi:predicted transcriptional regulator
MNSIELDRLSKRKNESRQIVKEILKFGVTENQKIDIMYLLAISIQENKKMKEITSFLDSYKTKINDDENQNKIKNNKILT